MGSINSPSDLLAVMVSGTTSAFSPCLQEQNSVSTRDSVPYNFLKSLRYTLHVTMQYKCPHVYSLPYVQPPACTSYFHDPDFLMNPCIL